MAWLDGGHNGGRDTWVTDEAVLASLVTGTTCRVDIRVTPKQVRDRGRPWIGEEEAKFATKLQQLMRPHDETRLKRNIYFENEEASLRNHFKVLDTICDSQIS